ncbi:MAG: hypothetical protein ABIR37_04065 [Candidatus Saccharimonadales bacterium]
MAANSYIQAAAAQLRSASQDLNAQARDAQTGYDHDRRHLESAIKTHEVEIKTKEASVAAMDDPVHIKGMRLQIAALQKLTMDRKRELDGTQGNTQNVVSAKLAFAQQLDSLASQLDGLAGRPEAS